MGYEISLRRQEAAFIEIVSLEEASDIVGIEATARDAEEAFAKHWEGRDKHIHVAFVGESECGKNDLVQLHEWLTGTRRKLRGGDRGCQESKFPL